MTSICIQSDRSFSAEYRIVIWATNRTEANIRYSPTYDGAFLGQPVIVYKECLLIEHSSVNMLFCLLYING